VAYSAIIVGKKVRNNNMAFLMSHVLGITITAKDGLLGLWKNDTIMLFAFGFALVSAAYFIKKFINKHFDGRDRL
jgi:hypothetical protein